MQKTIVMETQVNIKWQEVQRLWEQSPEVGRRHPWQALETELESLLAATQPYQFSRKAIMRFQRSGLVSIEVVRQPLLRRLFNRLADAFCTSADLSLLTQRLGFRPQEGHFGPCMLLWILQEYPCLGQWLTGRAAAEAHSGLREIPFRQFIRYSPAFVLCRLASIMENPVQMSWVRWMAMGHNIRKAPHLPFPLSKRMAHQLTQAPCFYSFPEALTYAQVRGLGGSEALHELIRSYYGHAPADWSFRTAVIHFLVRHESVLAPAEVFPLLAYIEHCRQEIPGFSLKGRGLRALQRQAAGWELERQRQYYREQMAWWSEDHLPMSWRGAPWPEYERVLAPYTYRIIQLTTPDALIDEGIYMHHCVASYAYRCYQGKSFIWSLRQFDADGQMQRLVTIELDQQGRVIQARRAYNAMPRDEEMEMIRRWEEGNR